MEPPDLSWPRGYTLGWLSILTVIIAAGYGRAPCRRAEAFTCVCGLLVLVCALARWGPHILPPCLEEAPCVQRGLLVMLQEEG